AAAPQADPAKAAAAGGLSVHARGELPAVSPLQTHAASRAGCSDSDGAYSSTGLAADAARVPAAARVSSPAPLGSPYSAPPRSAPLRRRGRSCCVGHTGAHTERGVTPHHGHALRYDVPNSARCHRPPSALGTVAVAQRRRRTVLD